MEERVLESIDYNPEYISIYPPLLQLFLLYRVFPGHTRKYTEEYTGTGGSRGYRAIKGGL